jgi:multiple sugar transport system permease protein
MQDTKMHRGQILTESQFGFLLVLPAIAVFCFIIVYPFINSLGMSFFNKSLLKPGETFIGFQNFTAIFSDPNFSGVLVNTLVFVALATFIPFTLGFIWAIILNQKFRGSEILRGITLCNWIIPGTAIGFLWMWIFNGQYGVLNALLKNLGLIQSNISWLGYPGTAMAGVIVARTWQIMPWFMALLMAGLQGISLEQVEAARIDGAGNWGVFRYVVMPGMRFIISLALILGTVGALQQFDIIWVMTQGGPARTTTTLAIEVYRKAFQDWDLGKAASIGAVWVLLLSVFIFFYLKRSKLETEN